MHKFLVICFCFCSGFVTLFAQSDEDRKQWAEMHNWDGITPWNDYIIYFPYYLGPNALTVPFSEKGLLKDQFEFEARYDYHWSSGDQTQNIFLNVYIPLLKNRIALEAYGVLYEHYKMDMETVYERRTRNMSGEGHAFGDLYIGTVLQIIRDRKFPDLALRISFRTASGDNLANARYTDAAGYFFDLSFGKDYLFEDKFIQKIRYYGMIGFYVWQLNQTNNMQDDAVLFGLGIDIYAKTFILSNAIEGYSGYFGNKEVTIVKKDEPIMARDRPILYRCNITKTGKHIDLKLAYQLGIHDFTYQTISFSVIYHLPIKGLYTYSNQ